MAFVEWCVEIAAANAAGETQEAIGQRYGFSQPKIGQAVRIGNDPQIIRNANNLPLSQNAILIRILG